jgi:hypothetical protein
MGIKWLDSSQYKALEPVEFDTYAVVYVERYNPIDDNGVTLDCIKYNSWLVYVSKSANKAQSIADKRNALFKDRNAKFVACDMYSAISILQRYNTGTEPGQMRDVHDNCMAFCSFKRIVVFDD